MFGTLIVSVISDLGTQKSQCICRQKGVRNVSSMANPGEEVGRAICHQYSGDDQQMMRK